MHVKSGKQFIDRPVNLVYSFIEDFRNFRQLIPEQVENYQADYDNCSFEISGMGQISLLMIERNVNTQIKASSGITTKIKFQLTVNLYPENSNSCFVIATLDAELSPMLEMIAKTPLNNFINMLVDKLKQEMESA